VNLPENKFYLTLNAAAALEKAKVKEGWK